nr:MAG TPA: hypothetical protein [Caudoviricetes sp.]
MCKCDYHFLNNLFSFCVFVEYPKVHKGKCNTLRVEWNIKLPLGVTVASFTYFLLSVAIVKN